VRQVPLYAEIGPRYSTKKSNLAEQIDQTQKDQQAKYPDLTLTGMSNVLENLAPKKIEARLEVITSKDKTPFLKAISDQLRGLRFLGGITIHTRSRVKIKLHRFTFFGAIAFILILHLTYRIESVTTLKYIAHYSEQIQTQAGLLITSGRLSDYLEKKYPDLHEIQSDKALYQYVTELKNQYMRKGDPIYQVSYNSKLKVLKNALGVHTYQSRVQGSKLKSHNSITVASLFKEAPPEFLRMIAVHELSHLREKEHNKAFYRLCCHMEPDYHQLELDTRLWLHLHEH